MSEDIEKEFRALSANYLALEIIVQSVLSKLAREPSLRRVITASFDQAADAAQSVAIELGQPAEVLRIIEETRAMVLGTPKPSSTDLG